MTDLFRQTPDGIVIPVSEQRFVSEERDLEEVLYESPRLIGDTVDIVARQLDTRTAGIMDLVGVDRESNQIIIYELKNVPADVRVLLQILRYGVWTKSNSDSLRYLISQDSRPELAGLVRDLDFVTLRLAIVAPSISSELMELAQYVGGFEFEFFEMRRFSDNDDTFLAVDRLVPPALLPGGTSVQEEWSLERYVEKLGVSPERAELGRRLLAMLEGYVHERGWDLRTVFRKVYTPLQTPTGYNVMGTRGWWKDGWAIWFSLPEDPTESGPEIPEFVEHHYWREKQNQIVLGFTRADFDIKELSEFLERSYAHISEKHG